MPSISDQEYEWESPEVTVSRIFPATEASATKIPCRIPLPGGDILLKMSATVTNTDLQLLARYTRDHAEDAFAEIVRRHVDLVHSAALRQVRSPQLAEEVAQSAFTDLAQNAAKLRPDTIVTAWLYQVTRRTAIDVVRREARRQLREQIATEMNAMNASGTGDSPVWSEIEPLLDEAMSALDDTDRAAILLRYFENKSLREVGQQLGTSDDAAQKRVSRAVERLREFFAKRGVTVGASGLVVVISANAIQAAPVGLAVTISTAATLAGATFTATIATQTTVTTMNWLNIKAIAAIVVAAVAAGTGTHLVQQREATRLRDENQDLVAEREELTTERAAALSVVAASRDEIQRLQKNQAELLRLRGEVGLMRRQLESLKAQTTSQPAIQRETSKPGSPPPGSYLSKDQLTFAGYATPETALETITWTMMNGTYDQANEGLSPALLAGESKDQKSREGFEARQKTMAPLFKGMQIVAKKLMADDKVELKVRMDADPIPGQQHDMPPFMIQPMVKIGDAWKIGGSTTGHEEAWDKDGQIQTFTP